MAIDQELSDLAAAGALDGTEKAYVVKGGVSKRTTTQDIADLGASAAGHALLFSAASGSAVAAPVIAVDTAGYGAVGRGAARYVYDAAVDAPSVAANPLTQFLAADGRGFRLSLQQLITDFMFGAVDGTTGDSARVDAMEAWSIFVWANRCQAAACLVDGTINREAVIGGASNTLTMNIYFGPKLKATAVMDAMATLQNLSSATVDVSGCELRGANSGSDDPALSIRLAKTGLNILDARRANITGVMQATGMYYWALGMDPAGNSNFCRLPFIRAFNCGSSPIAGGGDVLTANWSAPVRNGAAASNTQTTTLTVDAVPAYDDPIGCVRGVKIAGYIYPIASITGAGPTWTLTLDDPWLDDTSYAAGAGTGTLEYVFGGAWGIEGIDNNALRCQGVDALRSAYCVNDGALYGSFIDFIGSTLSEVWLAFGNPNNSTQIGGKVSAGYIENAGTIQIISHSNATVGRVIGNIGGQGVIFSKWLKYNPRNSGGKLNNQRMIEISSVEGVEGKQVVAGYGHTFTATFDPPSIPAGTSASTTMVIPGLTLTTPVRAEFSLALSGLLLSAVVTSVNASNDATVTITFFNPTSAAINLASGTLTVTAMKGESAQAAAITPGATTTNAIALIGLLTSDVASIAAGATADVAVTVTGAAAGDDCMGSCTAALPAGIVIANSRAGTNSVVITLQNTTAGAIDPGSLTYIGRVWKR